MQGQITRTISCVAVSVAGTVCACLPGVVLRARAPARVSWSGRLYGAPGADPTSCQSKEGHKPWAVSRALSAMLPCPPPLCPPHRGCWDLGSGGATARPEERQRTDGSGCRQTQPLTPRQGHPELFTLLPTRSHTSTWAQGPTPSSLTSRSPAGPLKPCSPSL